MNNNGIFVICSKPIIVIAMAIFLEDKKVQLLFLYIQLTNNNNLPICRWSIKCVNNVVIIIPGPFAIENERCDRRDSEKNTHTFDMCQFSKCSPYKWQ